MRGLSLCLKKKVLSLLALGDEDVEDESLLAIALLTTTHACHRIHC